MTMMTETHDGQGRLHIDLEALAANWAFFGDNGNGAICSAVIKANGYGLGVSRVAQRLAKAGCNTFFVAHLGEGITARAALGGDATIYVLNGLMAGQCETFHAHNLTPVLNDLNQIDHWRSQGLGAPAALHVDTGMNRLGIAEEDIDAASEALDGVNLSLIMSHLACASDPAHSKNAMQRHAFVSAAACLPPAPLSLAASAGILLDGDFCFDLVRPGIGLYGGGPFDMDHVPLAPVATLEVPIIQLRRIGPGDTVGYGALWQADRAKTIATVALGYADGFLRSGSSRGFAILGGAVCPIVGRVSMDLITLDVTAAGKAAKVGAYVQFLGRAAPIDAQAQALDTISYELLTGLGNRFVRTYSGEE
jgi:alanine racemase